MDALVRHLMAARDAATGRPRWGMLFTSVKPDEADKAQALAGRYGRAKDFIRFSPSSGLAFDFLSYERSQPGGSPQTMARLLSLAVDINSRTGGKGDSEPFWAMLAERVFLVAITTLCLANGTASVRDVHRFITGMPNSNAQIHDPQWARDSFFSQTLRAASARSPGNDLDACTDFFTEWINLSDKTRSVAYTMCVNVTSQFLMGPLSGMVAAGRVDVSPDDCLAGKIVCIDAPILLHGAPATFLNCIFKTLTQRAAQRRDVRQNPTPVALIADECHYTLVPGEDLMALTTCRSARLAHICATQGLPACYAQLGGTEKSRHEVEGWCAQFGLKILTCNGCTVTNKYASDMIGSGVRYLPNSHPGGEDYNAVDDFLGQYRGGGAGMSGQIQPLVPEVEFTRLLTGGEANGRRVSAILFASGRRFSSRQAFLRAEFVQQPLPPVRR